MDGFLAVLFYFIVVIYSIMAHEVSHGAVADALGDPTARLANRLNFNPLNHIDPLGSIFLPFFLYYISGGSFIFGWAKPVPYNPYNLRNPEKAAGVIAGAGPLTNISIALLFGLFLRFFGSVLSPVIGILLAIIVKLNINLAVFNLIPLPPLDGSKILFAILGRRYSALKAFLEVNGMIFLFIFIFFGLSFISPITQFLYNFIVG